MQIVRQSQASECSLACLAMVASAYGLRADLEMLRRKFPISSRGSTLAEIASRATEVGLTCRGLRIELHELRALRSPHILHWDLNHFVVLKKVTRRGIVALDPAVGERRMSMDDASRHFTGVALELTPNADFKPEPPAPRLRLSQLTGRVHGLKRSLLQIFATAVALEVFALTAPLLNQMVVDEVLTSGDRDLLLVVMLGFGLLLIVQTAIGLARSWMVMVLAQTLNLQWSGNVFAHMIRLPMQFFEQRHLGDVVSRFGAVGALQQTLTTAAVEAVLDGLMAAAALVMMFVYAPMLGAITFSAVLAYGLLRWLAYRPFRDAAAERLVVAARENTHFLETLRAIQPLKLFGREQERQARWQNLVVEVQNRDACTARMNIGFTTASTFIFGLENLLVLGLGARAVMAATKAGSGAAAVASFTVGMLFAFLAYKDQFTKRVSALINYGIELKMLGLHVERLSDIALTRPEKDDVPVGDLAHLAPALELRNVSFRYGEGEPWILRNANLVVRAGESLAVTGPSGAGKTTMLKVVLGLLAPSEGEVLYGGLPMRQLGIANVRRCIGTVMQDDAILTGSLADNISFFDTRPDQQRIEACASLAQLHAEIIKMPMGYQTLVGDLGTGLSGGQKQRLLLARALYKRPKVLALDEATSHLDLDSERAVALALRQMKLTRLIIAHRPETIAGAQRVVRIEDGQVVHLTR